MVSGIFILKILVYIIIFIFFFSLLQFLVSIHPVRFKSNITPKYLGLDYESVEFKTLDNVTLRGWLIEAINSKGTIVIGHGYPMDKGNVLPVTSFLYPEFNLLYYDHRYFGESEGRITTAGLRETKDVEAAVRFLHERFGKRHKIGLYGFSLSASSMLMANVSVRAIVADSSYADLSKIIERLYFYYGPVKWPFVKLTELFAFAVFRIHPKNISTATAVNNIDTPILLIHGEKDSQIPVENAYIIKEANPNIELWIVPNADHGQAYAVDEEEYEKRVKGFFEENIK